MKPSCFLLEGTSKEQAGAKQLQAGKLQVVVGAASHAPTQGQMDWLSNNQSIIYDHYVVAIFLRGILYRLEHIWELSRKRGSHQEPLLLNGNGKLFGHQEETLTSFSHFFVCLVCKAGRWWGGNWRCDCTTVAEIRAILVCKLRNIPNSRQFLTRVSLYSTGLFLSYGKLSPLANSSNSSSFSFFFSINFLYIPFFIHFSYPLLCSSCPVIIVQSVGAVGLHSF